MDPQEDIMDEKRLKCGSETSQADMRTMANESAFLNRLEKKKTRMSYVTEDTVSNYKLEDVQMVVPGHGVAYPKVFSRFSHIPTYRPSLFNFVLLKSLMDHTYANYFITESGFNPNIPGRDGGGWF